MYSIKLSNISKYYNQVRALNNISLNIGAGEIHGILGLNGAGKSSLFKIIAGLTSASNGELLFNDKVDLPKIGYLPESPPLYQNMVVKDFLKFLIDLHDVNNKEGHLKDLLSLCNLEQASLRLIKNLSKGYKQRVGLAQSLVGFPEIILLDEPLSGLDPTAIIEMRSLINNLKKNHTILLSTHQLYEASLICSNITILKDGEVIQTGTLQNLQSKLQVKQLIRLEVSNWSNIINKKIETMFCCSSLWEKKDNLAFEVKLYLNSEEEVRPKIVEFIVENSFNLLSIDKVTLPLEEVFSLVTSERE
ncbi:MAG: ABC transporter ATP-binding protein [Bdellovibrionales bacterium]|jgi:ABC-2 type transport system ATP-binding protein|nr:ABC transporter ATP-binding protein [Bdellovibrionales bacterium]